MAQIRTWTVTLVFDDLAFPGCQWWARWEDAADRDGWTGMATRLCDDPGEALLEVAERIFGRVQATSG